MWVAENIQACLRIFRRAQHQWLVRDIYIKRKGFFLFLSYGLTGPIRLIRLIRSKKEEPVLRRTALQAAFVVCYYTEGVAPGYSW